MGNIELTKFQQNIRPFQKVNTPNGIGTVEGRFEKCNGQDQSKPSVKILVAHYFGTSDEIKKPEYAITLYTCGIHTLFAYPIELITPCEEP